SQLVNYLERNIVVHPKRAKTYRNIDKTAKYRNSRRYTAGPPSKGFEEGMANTPILLVVKIFKRVN
ncbi:MAG: hypothetical protein AB8G05_07165, partial [Oligoflexales bacterium]